MTANEVLSAQISELRWLVYELGREMQTLETTSRPHIHRFLVHALARKVALIASATCFSICLSDREEVSYDKKCS
jgi:hypothetical protein